MKKRILALDVGDVRIGLALSDPMQIIASPLETYTRKNIEADIEYIRNIVESKDVGEIVSGLPLSMSGNENEQVKKTKEFIEKLKEVVFVPITLFDERLTSVSAEEMLIDADVKRKDRKKVIDKIAASIILNDYLRSKE